MVDFGTIGGVYVCYVAVLLVGICVFGNFGPCTFLLFWVYVFWRKIYASCLISTTVPLFAFAID